MCIANQFLVFFLSGRIRQALLYFFYCCSHTVGRFYFGHSETIVQVFTALGLFEDQQPLLATNMASMQRREFRTSRIAPYSANIAFVLYACGGMGHGHDDDRDYSAFVMKILVNEKPVIIPACNQEQCVYRDVGRYYHDLVDHCEREKLCGESHGDDDDSHDHDDDDDDDDEFGGRGDSLQLAYSIPLLIISLTLLHTG